MLAIPFNISSLMTAKIYLAHRGSWHNKLIENTIRAFEETRKQLNEKLHGFECDLRQLDTNAPNSWVIFHDEDMPRLNESQTIIDPKHPIKNTHTEDHMPRLIDFCEWLETLTQPIIINIEIKNGTADGIQYLIQSLKSANQHNHARIIYSSFNSEIINELCHHPKESIGLLITSIEKLPTIKTLLQTTNRVEFISISFKNKTDTIMNELSKLNIPIGIYFSSLAEFNRHINEIENNPLFQVIFVEQ